MQYPNIYFVGKAGAGKTYLSRYLIDHYEYTHGKMAHSVYMLAEKYLGMNPEKKDRHLLQYLGSEVGRNEVEKDIWINRFVDDVYIVARTAKDLYNQDMYFVADDIRFENEHI